ncbi:MAG TPA: UvrD-helicase domain-containing protein, partial [Xanthomonadaceae bacterium]|nr:UvrD-helicase domain-containing protein [Xanthomonadaceae bacterium]
MSDALLREDRDARQAALDTGRSLIVQAPAGAGKTELLIRRVLALLPTVDAPEAIIAITFTRKAAAEMRQRILEQLAGAACDTPPEAPFKRETWRLARAARAHAEAQGWSLDDCPQRLRVMTIDALCAALVRQSPILSEVGGSLKVTEDARTLHAQAARATLLHLEDGDAAADAVAAALRHFDNNPAALEAQLATLLGGRERWRHLLDAGTDAAARRMMEGALAMLVREWLGHLREAIDGVDRDALLHLARFAARHSDDGAPAQVLAALDDLVADVESLPHWQALAEFCLTRTTGTFRATVNKNQGFPPGKAFKPLKDEMVALLAKLAERPGLAERLDGVRSLPHPEYDPVQWQALADLLAVLRLAMAELQLVFAERGEVDFTEIALRALTALGDEDSPGELLLRLDHRVQHLLVDEFQDTSNLQVELLRRLSAGWTPGDGRTLFLVGDPMQSIYRFRHANVGLFLGVRRDGLRRDLPLEPRQLRLNFRSQRGIVDWVNRVFAAVLPEVDDIGGGQVAYAEAEAHHPPRPGPAVHWYARHGDDAEAEAQAVAARCRELRAQGERAAILVRSRNHLAAIVPALREAGVPYSAVDIEGLQERPIIDDLRALTLALSHPGDRLSWLAVLRAPWCGLTLADLGTLTGGIGRETPLLPRLQAWHAAPRRRAAGGGPDPAAAPDPAIVAITADLQDTHPWAT